ncbi:MAG: hypothetical protein JWN98_2184 [Abditibacteriota bacterium]|nr:hypothetical protein [Abditibacteriota bacterium]
MITRILSEDELRSFDEDGYLVVREVVPPENCEAAIAAIFDFLEMDAHDPKTWYPAHRNRGGVVHLHQHQALWNNRQHARVYGAFADILGNEKLWVSMDRAGFKAPVTPEFPDYDDRGFVHWDLDTSQPISPQLGVQGVLCLADTTEEMGGFCCVPGFHKVLKEWIEQQPEDRNPRSPDLARLPDGMKVTPIPAKAGDLIIWNRLLAHGNGRNEGTQPRLAQYITMFPAQPENQEMLEERITCWQERRAPGGWYREIPERYQNRETQNPVAQLNPLGRRLLGIDSWEA